MAVGAHGLRKAHMRRLLEERVMEEVADVDEHRADHDRLPNEHDQWADLSVFEDLRAKRKCDVRDDGDRDSADLPRGQAATPVPPYGCDDHAGGAALKQGLEHRRSEERRVGKAWRWR